MARKPRLRSESDSTDNAAEMTLEARLGRMETEVEEINLTSSVQAKDIQTLRARIEQLKAEMDEISEGASAEDLARVESALSALEGRLQDVESSLISRAAEIESVREDLARHSKQALEAAEKTRERLEEIPRGEETSARIQEALETLRADFEKRLGKVRSDIEKGGSLARLEDLENLQEGFSGRLEDVSGRVEATRQTLRAELDSVHEVMRADLDNLRQDLASVPVEEIKSLQDELTGLKSSLGEAGDLGPKAREALKSVVGLEERLHETEARFQGLNQRVDEAASRIEGQLEKIDLATRLVIQLDERARKAGGAVEFGDLGEDLDLEEFDTDGLGFELTDLMQVMIKHQASDLHLKVGTPPTVRLDGELIPVGNQVLSPNDARYLILTAMTPNQRRQLAHKREVDFAYATSAARFRVNAFLERGNLSAAFRMLRTEMPSLEELGLPAVLKNLASLNNGLILVTGPAGSGKSTTLAALIDYINTTRKTHVITVEDPIEFFHKDKLSLITQREVGTDTSSFADALRQALRQDPNVIMVGEMRDPETIMTAVVAAETGHLVLSTMHTPNTVQAVDRIIDTFSGELQRQFRLLLSNSLKGVVSQRLLTRADEKGRVPATEVMIVTPTISSLILEGKTEEIYPYIQQCTSEGMQTFTQSLLRLYEAGLINKEEALFHADQPTEFRLGAEGHSTATASGLTDDTLMNWL